MKKVERLAVLLLDSSWTPSHLQQIVSSVSKVGSRAHDGFADRLTVAR